LGKYPLVKNGKFNVDKAVTIDLLFPIFFRSLIGKKIPYANFFHREEMMTFSNILLKHQHSNGAAAFSCIFIAYPPTNQKNSKNNCR